MKNHIKFFVMGALLALSACAGSDDLGAGKTGKHFEVTGHSYDRIWNASLAALSNVHGTQSLEISKNLEITKQDKGAGIIKADSGISLLSYGEVVGVYITPPYNAPKHKIEVESLTRLKTNITSNNWEDEIIAAIKQNLAAYK